MKHLTITMFTLMLAVGLPMTALAMNHGGHDKEMSADMQHDDKGMHKAHDMGKDHADGMKHDMHSGHDMAATDDFIEVGTATQSGVVATVKVKAYDEEARAAMKKMGLDATHHVMVFFTEEANGKAVSGGKAAVKVQGVGDEAGPIMLMQMGDGFGTDISIREKGLYTFEIGTKLGDGQKRQFEVGFHNM